MKRTKLKDKFTITLTPSVQERATLMAQDRGMNFSTFIEQLLRREIEQMAPQSEVELKAAANSRRR